MKILITGANGFVGRHLVTEFVTTGHSVLALGMAEDNPFKGLEHISYASIDLRNATATRAISFVDIDAIVHLAGLAAVGPSFDAPFEYISTNAGIEINLFEAALAQSVKPKFLIVSSGSLYDSRASLPITEQSDILPNSPYAVSKLTQEELARYYSTRGFETIIARPFNHIGPGQGLGFIVPDLTKQVVAVENGTRDTIMVGNLEAQRDYTDVRDIARAYRLLLEKGTPGEIYNICSGKSTSGQELLQGIIAQTSVRPTIEEDPSKMRPSDTPLIYGNHDKLTRDTGWEPEIDLQTTLHDTVTYWRSQR